MEQAKQKSSVGAAKTGGVAGAPPPSIGRACVVIGCFVVLWLGVFGLSLPVWGGASPAGEVGAGGAVGLEFFFEQGCDACVRVRGEVFPEVERRYADGYRLQEYDIAVTTNYLRLAGWLNRLGIRDNAPVLLVVDGREALAGYEAIRDGVFVAIDRAMARRVARAGGGEGGAGEEAQEGGVLRRHVAGFTLAGIVAAAAVDSINPCMVATLVFFLSLLSVSHMGVRRMMLAGGAFVVACYVTYFLLGLGLLGVLRVLTAVQWVKRVFEAVVLLALVVFSSLSFLDAARYRRTGRGDSLRLRLPDGLQRRIHAVMKRGLSRRHLLLGGLGIGVLVTLMESVCTGQVYVPALALMIKSGQSVVRCAFYLGLYNLIFVMPLVILLGLTCAGLGTPALVDWSRRNVVFSKVSLGLFFAVMAVMMLVLR